MSYMQLSSSNAVENLEQLFKLLCLSAYGSE